MNSMMEKAKSIAARRGLSLNTESADETTVSTASKTKKSSMVNPFASDTLNDKYHATVIALNDEAKKNKRTVSAETLLKDAYNITDTYGKTIFDSYNLSGGSKSRDYWTIGENAYQKALNEKLYGYRYDGKDYEALKSDAERLGVQTTGQIKQQNRQSVITTAKAMGAMAADEESRAVVAGLGKIGTIAGKVRDYGFGRLTPEEQDIWQEALNDDGFAALAGKDRQYWTDDYINKMDAWATNKARRLGTQEISFDDAEKYLTSQGWQYAFAKAHKGDMQDYIGSFDNVGGIAKKVQKNGYDSLTPAEQEVWQYAVNDEDNAAQIVKGIDDYTDDDFAALTAWGSRKGKELASANGIYHNEDPDYTPEQKYVLSAMRNTLDGAREYAEEAAGTKDEEAAKEKLWFLEKQAKFAEVKTSGNFAVDSQADAGFTSGNAQRDYSYRVINNINHARDDLDVQTSMSGGDNALLNFALLSTGEEKGTYNALMKSGKYEEADEYLDYMSYAINERLMQYAQESAYKLGNDGVLGAIGASAVSVLPSVFSGLGYLSVAAQKAGQVLGLTDRQIDYNTGMQRLGAGAQGFRQGVMDQVDWKASIFGHDVDVFDSLYSTLMSGADSLAAGAFGNAMGFSAKSASKIAGAMLGSAAAQSTMMQIHDDGGSNAEALLGGGLAGIFEGLFENWSIGKLFEDAQTIGYRGFKDRLQNIAKEALVNFSEEFNTEVADIAGDYLVRGDGSDIVKNYNRYIELGDSPKEAWGRVAGDMVFQAMEAGLGGALMGAGFGEMANVQANQATASYDKANGASLSNGLKGDLIALGKKMDGRAAELANKLDPAKASNKQVGELLRAVVDGLPKEYQATVKESVKNDIWQGLNDGTMTVEAADAIADMMTGQQLQPTQIAALAGSEAGMKAMYQLLGVEKETVAQKATEAEEEAKPAPRQEAPIEISPMPTEDEEGDKAQEASAEAEAVAQPAEDARAEQQAAPAENAQEGPENAKESKAPQPTFGVITFGGQKPKAETADAGSEGAKYDNTVKIVSFRVDNEGNVTAQTQDGQETELSDAGLTEDQQIIAREAAALPQREQAEMAAGYEAGQSARDYARGWRAIRDMTARGMSAKRVVSLYGDTLTPQQRRAAVMAGQEERAYKETQTRQAAKESGFTALADAAPDTEGVVFADVKKAVDAGTRGILRAVQEFVRDKGIQVRVYDTLGNKNGEYVTGKNIVNLALDADEGALTKTVSHELFHFIEDYSQEWGEKIKTFVRDTLEKSGFDVEGRLQEIMDKYRDGAGQSLTHEQAMSELAADGVLDVIGTEENLRALQKQEGSAGFMERFRAWVTETAAKLRQIIDRIGKRLPEVAALKDNLEYIEKVRDMFQQGLDVAAENRRTANEKLYEDAKNDPDVKRYVEAVNDKAMTAEDAQALRENLAVALFLRAEKGWIEQHQHPDEYETGIDRFRDALMGFTTGKTKSLPKALTDAGLDAPPKAMYGALAYAGRQLTAGEVQNAIKTQVDTSEERLEENKRTVANMYPVADLSGDEIQMKAGNINAQVRNLYEAKGTVAVSPELGDVDLLPGISTSRGHGLGQQKAAAYAAVKDVIENGKLISYTKNYEGKGHDRAIIAAPVTIAGVEYYEGVMLKRYPDKQRFYVHEVWAQEENQNKQRAHHSLVSEEISDLNQASSTAYVNSILDSLRKYKGNGTNSAEIKSSLKTPPWETDAHYIRAAEAGDMETAQEMVDEAAEKAMPNSKILDEDGKLLPVFHGTSERFNSFDMSKGRSTMDIQGAFFSPWEDDAKGYGENVGRYYLNITNPAPEGTAYKALNMFKGQNEAGKKAREYLISQGYDGVNNENMEFIAFYPEQIKSADPITYDDAGNVIPLSERFDAGSPDIRYSQKADTQAQQEKEALDSVSGDADLYAQMKQDENALAALQMLMKLHRMTTGGGADALIKKGAFESRLSEMAAKIEEATATKYGHRKLMADLRKIYQAMEGEAYNPGEILEYARDVMQRVLEASPGVLVEQDETTKEIIRQLKNQRFFFTDGQKSEIKGTYGSVSDYTRKNFGKMRIVSSKNSKTSLADFWRETLSPLLPGTFAEDENEADMPGILDAWLENANEKKFAGEFGRNIGAYATDMAMRAMLDFYDVPGALKSKNEIREEYQAKWIEETKRLNQLRKNAEFEVNQAKLQYEDRYKQRVEKAQARKKDTEARNKIINEIKAAVRPIKTRVMNPTDSRHIPEDLRWIAEKLVSIFSHDNAVFSGQEMQDIALKYARFAENGALHDAPEAGKYDKDIQSMLDFLAREAGESNPLRGKTAEELQLISNVVQHIGNMIETANQGEVDGRKIEIDREAARYETELRSKKPARLDKLHELTRKLIYRELTPIYYAKQVGGILKEMMEDLIINGQRDYIFKAKQGRVYMEKQVKAHHVQDWLYDAPLEMKTSQGDELKLTKEQAMTLYAWWVRETSNTLQNAAHLRLGGFTYDTADKNVRKMKGVRIFNSHVLSQADMNKIIDYLGKEGTGFVSDMVDFLSNTCAEWGNETSMKLFGYKKYGEKWYFPYPTDSQFRGQNLDQGKQQKKRKNMSASHMLTENAHNPLKLGNFTQIWANHVDDMALYNATATRLDTMERVTNYVTEGETRQDEEGVLRITPPSSVKKTLEEVMGRDAVRYLESFINDVNGGVRGDERGLDTKAFNLFKKGSVAANLSVTLQQPSAFVRAMSMVNPKYFVKALNPKDLKGVKARMYEHSGAANIKDMGRFDTNMGKSAGEWIGDSIKPESRVERVYDFMDKWTGAGAEKADEITWCYMYAAIENEIEATTDLQPGTAEFNQAVGKRFDTVMTMTQVYDSTMSKSEWMRSTSFMDKMMTSFMAEPTLWANMLIDSAMDLANKRPGAAKGAAISAGVLIVGSFVNALLKSISTALRRKKDEGRTFLEKYLAEVSGNFADDVSPLGIAGLVPYARDIVSIIQGYDVERADMTLFQDLWKKIEKVYDKGLEATADDWLNLAGSVGNVFGIPARNVIRDVSGIYSNLFAGGSADEPSTGRDILYSIMDETGLTIPFTGNGFGAWNAERNAYYDRMEQALLKGDMAKYNELRGYMEETNGVKPDTVTEGVKAELKDSMIRGLITDDKAMAMLEEHFGMDHKKAYDTVREWEEKAEHADEKDWKFKQYGAILDQVKAGESVKTTMQDMVDNGYTEKAIRSEIKSGIGQWYRTGEITRSQAESKLKSYADMTDENDIYWTLDKWDYIKAHGSDDGYSKYTDFIKAVETGNNLQSEAKRLVNHGIKADTLADDITKKYKKQYVSLYKTNPTKAADLQARLLTAYAALGYDRIKKQEDIKKWLKE